MNNMQHIPLDEILLMSFKAADDGNEALAENLYNSFENAKEKDVIWARQDIYHSE